MTLPTTPQQQPTHTPEPWIAGYPGSSGLVQINVFTDGDKRSIVQVWDWPEAEANAQRIVACVNALVGIPDPAAALTQAREALEECLDQACSSTHQTAPYPDCTCWACERTRRVRAALAALEGRAQP